MITFTEIINQSCTHIFTSTLLALFITVEVIIFKGQRMKAERLKRMEHVYQQYKYKLKKGEIEYTRDHMVATFFMWLDSIDLPLDEIMKNYDIQIDETLYKQLKELGY